TSSCRWRSGISKARSLRNALATSRSFQMSAGTLNLPFFRHFLEQAESRLQVIGQGRRMIERASVQPEALGIVAPGLVDGPLKEVFPKSLTDEAGHEAELDQLDVLVLAAIQLRETGRRPLGM